MRTWITYKSLAVDLYILLVCCSAAIMCSGRQGGPLGRRVGCTRSRGRAGTVGTAPLLSCPAESATEITNIETKPAQNGNIANF